MGRTALLATLMVTGSACNPPGPKPERASTSITEPGKNPIRKGFTGEPPPGTVELPQPAPLLSPAETGAVKKKAPTSSEREAAQAELGELLREFERKPEPQAVERIRAAVVQHAREGRLVLTSATELHQEYQYPNDLARADEKYKGRVVVLTATVLPANVAEMTDIYKVFEQEPYVQDPLLLKTEHDVTFVRCRLGQPALQKLADWQPIQLVGIVEGKVGSNVAISRCVVLH